MATAGRISGDIIMVQYNGKIIAVSTSCQHSIGVAQRETTSKDDAGKYNGVPTKVTETIKGDFLVAFDQNDYQTIRSLARAKTLITYKFGSTASGDPFDTGTAFFTSVDISAPNNDNVTGSYALQVTGAVTASTNP